MSAQGVIGALQATLAEQGKLDFVGFSYPPRQREALEQPELVLEALGDVVRAVRANEGAPAQTRP